MFIEKYVLILGLLLGVGHIFFLIYRTVLLLKKQKGEEQEEGVSVIITSSNKAEELKENLIAFLEQDYPNFEIIVVDECSEDNTQEVLADFQKQYSHLKTTRIFPGTKFRRTKKIALNIGILAASHDILLFSEIDARPASKNWIRTMQSYFTPDTAVVLGYGDYLPQGWFSVRRFFRFLRFWNSWILIQKGLPIVGNGYNMGYRKKYYLQQRGFSKNSHEYIGYDTEMVQELSQLGDVKMVKEEEGRIFILNNSCRAWQDDVSYYCATQARWPIQAFIWCYLDFVLEMAYYLSLLYLLIYNNLHLYLGLFVGLTFLIDLILINMCLKQLGLKKLFITSLIVNSIGFVYKGYYTIYSIFTRKKWK